ncbi:MAG: hypothetical protein ACOX4I_02430 [Anaerovoracaceae bacterium]|jgi:hypothetical protein
MKGLAEFRNRIFVHCIVIAIAAELISLAIIGADIGFLAGIAIGTFITMINFNIMVWSAKRMLERQSKGPVVGGYFIRMPIYGVIFYLCLMISGHCAIACVIGFLSLHVSIMLIYGIESRMPGAKKNPLNDWTEPKKWRDPSEWEDDDDDFKDF